MAERVRLTPKRISDFQNPHRGKAILWDEVCSGLGVLASPTKKNFIFQDRFNGKSIRVTIGNIDAWTVEDARARATELKRLVNQGIDPREQKKRTIAAEEAARAESKRQDITIREIWSLYIEERHPHWSEIYYNNHERMIAKGGESKKRGKGKRVAGALASIAELPLSEITSDVIKKWMATEAAVRPTETRRAFEMLRTFLNWCEDDKRYKGIAALDACSAKVKKDNLPQKQARDDALQREQLPAFFSSVRQYENKVLSVYVQMMLLVGARREELLSLKWSDVDFKWKKFHIIGKGAVPRDVPLCPYAASLLNSLPRKNEWVFSSPAAKNGRLQSPTKAFQRMMSRAEIEDITLHGLRRSFSTLSEWLETPVGIVYQIQGHKPSATAEKHYKKRSIDLLRMWHIKIEKWMLEQAGVQFDYAEEQHPGLKLVNSGKG